MKGSQAVTSSALLIAVSALLMAALSCSGRPRGPEVGGLYSVADGAGFRVAKVLVVEPNLVHVRLYRERWAGRPEGVDPRELSLGRRGDAAGVGIGHLALSRQSFREWQPVLVARDPVRPEELEGYETWKTGQVGTF